MRQLACALLAIVALPLLGADVYRWVDADGTVVYSDRPEGEDTQVIHVATSHPAASESVPSASPPTEQSSEPASPGPEVSGGEIPREPTAEEFEKERERNCTLSREREERYRTSHRLYRNLPNGEREYLSDAQIDKARADAEADVAYWCR